MLLSIPAEQPLEIVPASEFALLGSIEDHLTASSSPRFAAPVPLITADTNIDEPALVETIWD